MRATRRVSLLLFVVIAWLGVGAPVLAAFPEPQGRVNDFAGVLDAQARGALEEIVRQTEQATSAELAVVTVASLDGMSVEAYAVGLFQRWGIGKKGADNGVLVLICPPERKMRVEVGYGLEGVLPDGLAGAVIREQFTPRFRENDYGRGTVDGVRRIGEILRANHVLTPEERRALDDSSDARPPRWLITPFFGLFVAIGGLALGAGLRTRSLFPLLFGGLFGGIPAVMSLVPFFNASLIALGLVALVALAVGYLKIGTMNWATAANADAGASTASAGVAGGRRRRRADADTDDDETRRASGSRSSSSSSSSSSRSSWSSGSSSDSSFGGGRSGGGGASGSW